MFLLDQVTGVGVLLLLGYLGGQLAKKVKLPAVAGYCLTGCLMSPSIFNLVPGALSYQLDPLKIMGLGLIAMIIGGELKVSVLRKIGKSIVTITIFQIVTTVIAVFVGMYFLTGKDFNISIILAALATATAPAATVAVMKEYKAKGKFSSTLLGVIALDDALCIILVGLTIALVKGFAEVGVAFEAAHLAHPAMELLGSIFIGIISGIVLCYGLKYISKRVETVVVLLAFVLINSGVAIYFEFSALLVNMICGAVVVNLFGRNPHVLSYLEDIDLPIFIVFFTLAGASLHLDLLAANWLPALIYILTRAVGKISGCYYGAKISGAEYSIQKYMGLAMLPKAGVSIGLILFVQSRFPGTELAAIVTAIELAAVTFYEITGPMATRYALIGAGDAVVSQQRKEPLQKFDI